ncbi:hypothetical protein [Exiguobacterium oxidotolerans]|uniref:hypothetical protein n=1 Tax=Exiguobacterium oxidotolerans TaxID=223958 RepID=UPI000494700A|nr:hypothetical protein [Exiguobacterium oxidotolerans]
MDNALGIIAVIIILLFLSYLLFRKFSRYEAVTDSVLPPITSQTTVQELHTDELPWEIESYSLTDTTSYHRSEPIIATKGLKDQVSNIIKLSPHAKNLIQKEQRIIIKFSEEALAKLTSGELRIMKAKGSVDQFRALAVDHQHRIRHHGKFEIQDIKKINPAQLANLALGVATMVTAQEHLDRINQQLTSLNQKVDTLIRQSKNDKAGIIKGHIRYLLSILPSIPDEEERYSVKLEDMAVISYQELESILPELDFLVRRANDIEEKTTFKLDKTVDEIKELAASFEQTILIGYGNLEVMSICLKIMNDWNQDSQTNAMRLSDIEKYHQQLTEYHDEFEKILSDKHISLDATFRRNKTITSKKENIDKQLTYHQEKIRSNKLIVTEHIDQLKGQDYNSIPEPVDLSVDFDGNGGIHAIHRLK